MSKFTSFVWCAVTVCVVFASKEDIETMIEECSKEYGVTVDDVLAAFNAGDLMKFNLCFWGCSLKKIGFLNGKGQYDRNAGLTKLKPIIDDDYDDYNDIYAMIEKISKRCAPVQEMAVSDGEAVCERGALLAICFLKQYYQH